MDLAFLARDAAGSLFFPRPLRRRIGYAVTSRLPRIEPAVLRAASGPEPGWMMRRALDLPRVDSRIRALARQITAGAPTRYDKAARIEAWLSTNLHYNLNVDDIGRAEPLTSFLFDGMSAHCEYFATSMVVLARAAGLPARYVAGYLRGEKSRFSRRYTVRQSDAHAWVEIHFPGVGWVPFDPTPPAGRGDWEDRGLLYLAADAYSTAARWWDDYVIGIDLDDQARAFLALRDVVGGALSGGLAAVGSIRSGSRALWLIPGSLLVLPFLVKRGRVFEPPPWWWSRARSRNRTGDAPAFYRRLLSLLGRRGLIRRPAETPAEFAARAARLLPAPTGRRIGDLTDLYYRVRFAAGIDGRQGRRLGERLLADIRRDLRASRFRIVRA